MITTMQEMTTESLARVTIKQIATYISSACLTIRIMAHYTVINLSAPSYS